MTRPLDIHSMMKDLQRLRTSADARAGQTANDLMERFPRLVIPAGGRPSELFFANSLGTTGDIVIARGALAADISLQRLGILEVWGILELLEMGTLVS